MVCFHTVPVFHILPFLNFSHTRLLISWYKFISISLYNWSDWFEIDTLTRVQKIFSIFTFSWTFMDRKCKGPLYSWLVPPAEKKHHSHGYCGQLTSRFTHVQELNEAPKIFESSFHVEFHIIAILQCKLSQDHEFLVYNENCHPLTSVCIIFHHLFTHLQTSRVEWDVVVLHWTNQ